MEYSIFDLIRILLKKWHVILLGSCLTGGASLILSQWSYQCAIAQYAELTSATSPVSDFAQIVLRDTLTPPNTIRVIFTSFVFGVVLTSLIIFIITFIKDAAKNRS